MGRSAASDDFQRRSRGLRGAEHPNVYIDTSAYTAKRYPAALVDFMRSHGHTKVLFGTNYPMITPAKALEGLDDLRLDDACRGLLLGHNANRVFRLGID